MSSNKADLLMEPLLQFQYHDKDNRWTKSSTIYIGGSFDGSFDFCEVMRAISGNAPTKSVSKVLRAKHPAKRALMGIPEEEDVDEIFPVIWTSSVQDQAKVSWKPLTFWFNTLTLRWTVL